MKEDKVYTLTILPEIRQALFPLKPDEAAMLEQSILAEGIRDPLVVWPRDGQLVLVDGHNRYQIAKRHDLSYQVIEKEFANLGEVLEWIDRNQLGRRNLTDEQWLLVLGRTYEREKRQGTRTDLTCAQNEHKLETGSAATAKKIATEFGVTQATVRRAADFAKAVDAVREANPEAAAKILQGEVKDAVTSLPKVAKQGKEVVKQVAQKIASGEVKKVKDAVRNTEKEFRQNIATKVQDNNLTSEATIEVKQGCFYKLGDHVLYCGDTFNEEFIARVPAAKFAFADPPYNAGAADWDNGFVWRHDWLADKATITAVTPGIVSIFDFAKITHMPYKWSIACFVKNGMTRGALGFGNWIYIALFSKGSVFINSQDVLEVTIKTSETELTNHKGRKPAELLVWLIEKFTNQDDIVIDPFLGSGTTLLACEATGRRCFGGEINQEFCQQIISRWENLTGRKAEVTSDD